VADGPLTSRLQLIRSGDQVLVSRKPTGTLVLHDLKPGKRLYMLATGTGLAPFLSVVRDKFFTDIGLPRMNPEHDRAMLCGGPGMLKSASALLDSMGFKISPHIGVPGDYVIERAFVEK
jgi:ferredoxin-NADP reductase